MLSPRVWCKRHVICCQRWGPRGPFHQSICGEGGEKQSSCWALHHIAVLTGRKKICVAKSQTAREKKEIKGKRSWKGHQITNLDLSWFRLTFALNRDGLYAYNESTKHKVHFTMPHIGFPHRQQRDKAKKWNNTDIERDQPRDCLPLGWGEGQHGKPDAWDRSRIAKRSKKKTKLQIRMTTSTSEWRWNNCLHLIRSTKDSDKKLVNRFCYSRPTFGSHDKSIKCRIFQWIHFSCNSVQCHFCCFFAIFSLVDVLDIAPKGSVPESGVCAVFMSVCFVKWQQGGLSGGRGILFFLFCMLFFLSSPHC